jgi:hypothetical protein
MSYLQNIPAGYRSQASDCRIEIDWMQFEKIRSLSVKERLSIAIQLIRNSRIFSLKCLEQNFRHLTPPQFARKVAETWLQKYCPIDYFPISSPMTWIQDSISLAAILHRIFIEIDIPYYVTGGVAAIAYGEPRTTQDLHFNLLDDFERALTEAGLKAIVDRESI